MKFFKGCDEGVHRFQARYDKIAPAWILHAKSFSARNADDIYERHYVRDVCVRCGMTIERDSKVVPLVRSA